MSWERTAACINRKVGYRGVAAITGGGYAIVAKDLMTLRTEWKQHTGTELDATKVSEVFLVSAEDVSRTQYDCEVVDQLKAMFGGKI